MRLGQEALASLARTPAAVVVTDVLMDGISGIELCEAIRRRHPDVIPIVMTGLGSLDMVVDAMRAGAYDFVLKPVRVDALVASIKRALRQRALRLELRALQEADARSPVTGLIGLSTAAQNLQALVSQVADSDATVLITGESGTGKELVARAIHLESARRDQPFVAINCAAMPATLLESELFGHVRGAFTDAAASRSGLVLQAGAGTLFLDEIGEMPIEMQAKLLRTLQQRTVRAVGTDVEVEFKARIVAATNRDLEDEMEAGRFREDLFYRINVVRVEVPPLRKRRDDILPLAHHFMRRAARRLQRDVDTITTEAAHKLCEYDWPGNVRELENCMERAVALVRTSSIVVDCLPPKIARSGAPLPIDVADEQFEMCSLDQMERRYVRKVLGACGGNKTQAARVLGIDRRSLYRRLEE